MVSLDVHMFATGTSQPFILGLGLVGGGGVSENRKTKSCTRKEGENWYTRKHGETFMQVLPICGICITGMLERKFSHF